MYVERPVLESAGAILHIRNTYLGKYEQFVLSSPLSAFFVDILIKSDSKDDKNKMAILNPAFEPFRREK
jgi:hypothetical protein